MKPSILLIREDAEQWTGSDCCGKLEGENALPDNERVEILKKMGCLYMDLKVKFSDVILIDPRNQPFLFPKILRDLLRYRPPLWESLKSLLMFYSIPSVILNGKILFSGTIPDSSQVILRIQTELHSG